MNRIVTPVVFCSDWPSIGRSKIQVKRPRDRQVKRGGSNMAEADESLEESNDNYLLSDFINDFDLPQTVVIVDPGCDNPIPDVTCGSTIELMSVAIQSVLLTPCKADEELGTDDGPPPTPRKDNDTMEVSIEYPARYIVLPPPHEGTNGDKESPVIYETVTDLLKVCPPTFKANRTSTAPEISTDITEIMEDPKTCFKSGDKFKFRRIVREGKFGKYLQCRHENGNVMELPLSCRGNFSFVVDTESTFTVWDLVEASIIPRYLWQADDTDHRSCHDSVIRIGTDDDFTSTFEENDNECQEFENKTEEMYRSLNESAYSDFPVRYQGRSRTSLHSAQISGRDILYMDIPKIYIETRVIEDTSKGNFFKNTDDKWLLPLDSDMVIKCFCAPDYEHPAKYRARRTLWEIASDHSQPPVFFPLCGQIVSYPDIPPEFTCSISSHSNVILRRVEYVDKILARIENKRFFILGPNLRQTFCSLPRTFNCVSDLYFCKPRTELRVMEDVATDFPKTISLKAGDIIRVPKFQTHISKTGRRGSQMECRVLKCEKLNSKGDYEKLKLPMDLDLKLVELIAKEDRERWHVYELFEYLPRLPMDVAAGDFSPSVAPDAVLTLDCYVRDSVIVMSSFQGSKPDMTFSSRVCIEVPSRHKMVLDLYEDIPLSDFSNGFTAPIERVSLDIEEIFHKTYTYMETYFRHSYSIDNMYRKSESQILPHYLSSR